jgi:hypothetical protein
MAYFDGVKTLEELTLRYRTLVMQYHPDCGLILTHAPYGARRDIPLFVWWGRSFQLTRLTYRRDHTTNYKINPTLHSFNSRTQSMRLIILMITLSFQLTLNFNAS